MKNLGIKSGMVLDNLIHSKYELATMKTGKANLVVKKKAEIDRLYDIYITLAMQEDREFLRGAK